MTTLGARIREARETAGLTQDQVSAVFGISRNSVSLWESDGTRPSLAKMAALARTLGVTLEWLMDGAGSGPPARSERPPRPRERPMPLEVVSPPPMSDVTLPIYGLAVGGEDGRFYFNGEVAGQAKMPASLIGVRNAYALYVAGESMVPRYKPGELVWVNPHKSPVRGDDVIVQMHPEEEGDSPEGYIKEFHSRTPGRLVLWQWNPASEFVVESQLVKSIHVIVGRGG